MQWLRRGGSEVATDYRYTGQRWQAALGLYYYRARWYDPQMRRFVQADTIVPEPGNPQTHNRYSYVYNNPMRYMDPSGHDPHWWLYPPGMNVEGGGPKAPDPVIYYLPGTDIQYRVVWDQASGAEPASLDIAGALVSLGSELFWLEGPVSGDGWELGYVIGRDGVRYLVGRGSKAALNAQGLNPGVANSYAAIRHARLNSRRLLGGGTLVGGIVMAVPIVVEHMAEGTVWTPEMFGDLASGGVGFAFCH